ncbi:TadE-like protein [Bifidobacterium leontopitheci]|uniref:TadE-like protein n=2 Tax=Bifidobacterium leontopitheci TaxID=2650774 RepID=A0A6I1GKH2_9BIFI|nr:TadE-like protein [Bifidobacterium leontopitheci]
MAMTPAHRRHESARHRLAAIPPWLRKHDEGSGTMAGVMLIMLAGVLITVAAAAGHLLLCQARARSASDLAALSAAQSYWAGTTDDPCAVAVRVAAYGTASLERCTVDGDDVSVTVSMATKVPVASRVSRSSRAGPVDCVAPP